VSENGSARRCSAFPLIKTRARLIRVVQHRAVPRTVLERRLSEKHNAGTPRTDVARDDRNSYALRLANAYGVAFCTCRPDENRIRSKSGQQREPEYDEGGMSNPCLLQSPLESREVATWPGTRLSPRRKIASRRSFSRAEARECLSDHVET
jgi:hypothetical protein